MINAALAAGAAASALALDIVPGLRSAVEAAAEHQRQEQIRLVIDSIQFESPIATRPQDWASEARAILEARGAWGRRHA